MSYPKLIKKNLRAGRNLLGPSLRHVCGSQVDDPDHDIGELQRRRTVGQQSTENGILCTLSAIIAEAGLRGRDSDAFAAGLGMRLPGQG